jgi:hypothetical protein
MTSQEFQQKFQEQCDFDATCQAYVQMCYDGQITIQSLENILIEEAKTFYYGDDAFPLEYLTDAIRERLADPTVNLVHGSGSFKMFFDTDEESFGFSLGYISYE